MIITKQKTLTQHKKVRIQLKKLSQKFLLGAVCAGLMLNSLIPAGRSFAEGAVASIPQEMFMTKDELLQLCEGRTGENSLLAGKDTDKKIRINFGTRPEVVKYYSDFGNTAHEVVAGPMTWLLVGSEDGNSAVLYSEKPMISANELKYPDTSDNTPTQGGTDSRFQIDDNYKKYIPEANSGYPSTAELSVYPNHWGASVLRAQLNALFNDPQWFTTGEKDYMLPSTVTTGDTKNHIDYKTTDVLYAPRLKASDYDSGNRSAGTAGETDSFMINYAYWGAFSWLRSPNLYNYDRALVAIPYGSVDYTDLSSTELAVAAAFKLNLSSVIFTSAAGASAITRSGEAFAPIAVDTPMTLRIDGSSQNMGIAMFSEDKTAVTVQNAQGATLIVQGVTASGENWSYSKNITLDSDTITTEAISNANAAATAPNNVPDLALVNFENCKVWLEKPTDTGSTLSYAVMATDFVPSEKPETPGNPAEAPDKDNQNGAVDNQESSLDIAKTGDTVTCFAISALSLAAALSFGALLSSKIGKRKSN